MAENLNTGNGEPSVNIESQANNPGTTNLKDFLPFNEGFYNPDPNLFTINPQKTPVQLSNKFDPSETPTIQKDQIRDTTVGFNPFAKEQLAKSLNGDQSYAKNLIKKMNHQLVNLEDNSQYSKSFMYDASTTGAHKAKYKAYGQATYDKIGFNPEINNDEVFNANTSITDDFIRTATHAAWPMFTLGLIANPKSYFQMAQGDMGQDIEAAADYEEYSAIGQSTRGGVGAFFNNVFNSLAYSAGIMTEAAAEYALIGAIEGSLAGPEGTVAGGAVGGAVGAIKGLLTLPKALWNMGKYGGKMLTSLKNLEKFTAAKQLFNAAGRTTFEFVNPINNTFAGINAAKADNLTGLARSARTAGGLFRDAIGINMGLSEGRLEGGFVEQNVYDKGYDKFWKTNGRAPTDDEQLEIRKVAKVAGFQDTWKNGLLVFYSNKIAFPNLVKGNIFAGSSRTIRSVGKEFDLVFVKGAGKKGAKEAVTEGAYDIVDFNFKNALKGFIKPANFGKASLSYFKINMVEGAQEVMQDVLAKSTEDYYVNSFYDPAKATFDYSMSTLGNAFGHQVSWQGFETFMSGFVMGGMLRPFNGAVPRYAHILYNKYTMDPVKYKEYMDQRKGYGEQLKNAMNKMHKNPTEFLNERMRNYGEQSQIAKIIDNDDSDKKEKFDAANAGFMSDILTSLNAGTYKIFRENFNKYSQLTDQELEGTLDLQPGEGVKMRKVLATYMKKSDKTQERWDYAQKNLATKKLNLKSFKENTPEYDKASIYNKAIDTGINNLVFLNESFDTNLERVNKITAKLNRTSIFKNLPSGDFQTIMDSQKLSNTIDMLSTEIESLKNIETVDAQNQIQKKQTLLNALSKFESKQNNFNKMQASDLLKNAREEAIKENPEEADQIGLTFDQVIAEYNKNGGDPIAAYKESFEELLQVLSGSENNYQKVIMDLSSKGGIDDLFNDVKDIHKLEYENKEIIPYINLLTQPGTFYEHVERNYQWMRNLYLNRENYYKDIINQSVVAKENNDLLKSLADDNIYVDLDEFADWVKDPSNMPSYFIEATTGNERIIPKGSMQYNQYAQIFLAVQRMQEFRAAGDPVDMEGQLELGIKDLLVQKQNEVVQAEEAFEEDIKKETNFTLDELREQEAAGVEVTKPISQTTIDRKVSRLNELIDTLDLEDPNAILNAIKTILNGAEINEEYFNQDLIDNEIFKFVDDQPRLTKEVVPIYVKFEESYDLAVRHEAAVAAAATKFLINNEINRIQNTTEVVTEVERVEIINKTQSWADHQVVLADIEERYAQFIKELTDEFTKRGVTPSNVNIDVPTNTSWSEIEKLAPDLFKTLTEAFAAEVGMSPEDDKYDLVRANWLEQQADVIKEYNAKKVAERILLEQEAKQFKVPKFKYIKIEKGYEITFTSKIAPLVIIEEAYQKLLADGEGISPKTQKKVILTDAQKKNLAEDLVELNKAIKFLREQGGQVAESKFDEGLRIFNENITNRQGEIEKVLDEKGNLIERKIDGKVADRVTKKAEELDIELTPGKKPFSYKFLDTVTKTVKDADGNKTTVEVPSSIMSAFNSILEDTSIKDEDKVNAFMASFEIYVKSTKESVFKDAAQKGLNIKKFQALREALENKLQSTTNTEADIKNERAAELKSKGVDRFFPEELNETAEQIEERERKQKIQDEINERYDAKLNNLGTDTKADIERRRQEDLNINAQSIKFEQEFYDKKSKEQKEWIKKYGKNDDGIQQGVRMAVGSLVRAKEETNKINAKYDAELAALGTDTTAGVENNILDNFTEENVRKTINELAFAEASDIGNMIDDMIKDFVTREGTSFKKVTKPEKMSQQAFESLFGDKGILTKFRDGIIDGDYMVIGASDMLFDKELFENGLVGETDLIAINTKGEFNIIDVKALNKGSWDRFDPSFAIAKLKEKLTKEGKSEQEIEQNTEVVKLNNILNSSDQSTWSKKQYFRIQQSLYRNLFFNMTGIMPSQIGLFPIQVTYDTEGNLISATQPVWLDEDSTIELEYFDAVESIVPLKAKPITSKATLTEEEEQGLLEEADASNLLKDNVGKKVIYAGAVGTLILNNDGTYGIKKDGVTEDIYFEQSPVTSGDLSFNQVGIASIARTKEVFETIIVDGEKYTTKVLSDNVVEINGVFYKIKWSGTESDRIIESLSFNANDAEILKLQEELDAINENVNVLQKQSEEVLSKGKQTGFNTKIRNITNKLNTLTEEDVAIRNELFATRTALEKELEELSSKQDGIIKLISSDLLEKTSLESKISSLSQSNSERLMKGGNNNNHIFAVNVHIQNFKSYKGINETDQKKDLDNIKRLSVSPTIAEQIDEILLENFPSVLNTLITEGVSGINRVGMFVINNWVNQTILELEILGNSTALEGNLTDDVDNQINALRSLINDLQLIKLTKNGEISKASRKKSEKAFGPERVSNRPSVSKDEGPINGQPEGVPGSEGEGSLTEEEMRIKIAESRINKESLLNELDTEDVVTTKKGLKFIKAIENATLETLDTEYIAALEELKVNPGTINSTELANAYDIRSKELKSDMALKNIKKDMYLLPKSPIFGNTEVSPVVVTKKGPNSVTIKDVNTGQTENFNAEELELNFIRMTQEEIDKESGVELTPEDMDDFKQNIETINDTLEDSTALNGAVDAVEKAESIGSFRERLKNKNCKL
jgi:hypothetical protein